MKLKLCTNRLQKAFAKNRGDSFSELHDEEIDLNSSNVVQVVAILKSECVAREHDWHLFLADMSVAAHAGAIAAERRVSWLANVHTASSSARVARNFVHEADQEPVFLFYLRGAGAQACMQVRVAGDVATVDALCSLGGRSGETFMRHLVDWLPTAAPEVTSIAVTPLSDGWLRHEYYAGFGFVPTHIGGSMTRGVEAFAERSQADQPWLRAGAAHGVVPVR